MTLKMDWHAVDAGGQPTVALSGPLDRETVPAARRRSLPVLKRMEPGVLRVDLAGVTDGDSAGLALLVEWCRVLAEQGGGIELTRVALPIVKKIRLARLESLFSGIETDQPSSDST